MTWRRRALDGLEDDIREHIERETLENLERGMPAEAARLAAIRKFGNVARVMEETRGVWQRVWMEQLLQDIRYGLRVLGRNPRFAAVVVLTLALGIGINTAVFSVVNTVLLKPVAYPDADRLVWIADYDPLLQRDYANRDDYLDWRRGTHSYTGMAAYGWQPTAIATEHGASQLTAAFAAGDFWRITGAHAALGRLFGGEEADCLVLTWDSFEREFRGDAGVIGKPIVMNGHPATITGVLPRNNGLKDGGRNSAGPSGLRVRRVLAAVQLSLAIVLLTGAGLMLKSFARMNERAPGFVPENVIVMKIRLAGQQYRETSAQEAYFREVRRRIENAPGVESAGLSTWVRLRRAPTFPVDTSPDRTHSIRVNATTPGYLKALGMRLVRGRWLTDADSAVTLVNESQARQAFGTMDPIGRQLPIPRPVTVVGILADVKYSRLDAEATPEIFVPYRQNRDPYMAEIAARAAGDPSAVMRLLRKTISDIDPSQAVSDVKTLEQSLEDSIAPRRFNLFLLGTFAASALVLALIGIYGVIAYSVAERTREIGVRMALGARRGQVVGMVVREAVPIAMAGIGAGLVAAWGLTRLMASLLYGVEATDPATFAAVAGTLGIMAVAACVGPAMKAAWIDPMVALRWE